MAIVDAATGVRRDLTKNEAPESDARCATTAPVHPATTVIHSPQSWPTAGNWFFNPLSWQFLFVLGFVLADKDGLGGFTRARARPLMIAGIPLVILGALIMHYSWWPDPFAVPSPKLLFIADKTYMTPIRLIQFLALVGCSVTYTY